MTEINFVTFSDLVSVLKSSINLLCIYRAIFPSYHFYQCLPMNKI